ncbi:MAG TPA: glycoside hydrolase family 3 C-terminal domain-containing protein, partial [Bacteroidota bacterium]|nr:glycoside hydrolase family 3 C-terminal domain-containing protein [Bacteroidota bacterium]
TWNPPLIRRLGEALAVEARAKGRNMLLGPCININRVPVGGRSFESFGEDPFLMARMAVEYIRGVQSRHVIATAKHYAANNQEFERTTIDEAVDTRTLNEIYFPAFRAAVQEAGVLAVMSAYNKLNGYWCSENPWLLTDVLKKEWGFRGFVVSDWGAVHSTVPTANAGLDIEMPHGDFLNDSLLLPAVKRHDVSENVIDDKIRRMLRAMVTIGLFDPPPAPPAGAVNSPEHRALAREVEAEGIVLLQNRDNVLPIDPGSVKTIAVIGPNAAVARTGGGGSAYVTPFYGVSPLEGISAKFRGKAAVSTEPGCFMDQDIVPLASSWLRPPAPDQGKTGLRGEYFANQEFKGTPALTRIDAGVNFDWGGGAPDPSLPPDHFSVRWTGTLVPEESGEFQISIRSDDGSRLYVNGELYIDNWGLHAGVTKSRAITLLEGTPVEIRLEYFENDGGALVELGMTSRRSDLLSRAVELARKSDVAIICVGNSNEVETEGMDRQTIALPAGQDELIAQVAAANPRTVVVLTTGSPVPMPWAGSVGAIVQAWFGGQEVGNALADILTGDVNPSGKLPVTLLRSWDDTPARATYPGHDGKTSYAEGIFVGYRFFDHEKKDVLFPFGHGLSYTSFAYGPLTVSPVGGGTAHSREVSLEITNTGKRPGAEVVQLYVGERNPPVPRPPAELKAFAKVALAPGERKTVRMTLDESSFAFYDVPSKSWRVAPGTFDILVGSSSRDIRSRAAVELR